MTGLAFVYRAFDVDGDLLYVGCAKDVDKRMKEHKAQAEWFPLMVDLQVEGPWPRPEALSIEKTAARTESPQFGYTSPLTKARHLIYRQARAAEGDKGSALLAAYEAKQISHRDLLEGFAALDQLREVEARRYAEANGLSWALVDYSEPVAA